MRVSKEERRKTDLKTKRKKHERRRYRLYLVRYLGQVIAC